MHFVGLNCKFCETTNPPSIGSCMQSYHLEVTWTDSLALAVDLIARSVHDLRAVACKSQAQRRPGTLKVMRCQLPLHHFHVWKPLWNRECILCIIPEGCNSLMANGVYPHKPGPIPVCSHKISFSLVTQARITGTHNPTRGYPTLHLAAQICLPIVYDVN